jgi:hypothetical protein
VAHDSLVAVCGLQIGMLAEKVRDLGLDRLGQQSTRPGTQDFGELIGDVRQAPPRYAAFPIPAVTNFQR